MPAVVAALAAMTELDLRKLMASVNQVPQSAPGLFAWIEHAADWELRRRIGFNFPLQPPEAAIDPSEDEVSLGAAMMMRVVFSTNAPDVGMFFEALVGELTGGEVRH